MGQPRRQNRHAAGTPIYFLMPSRASTFSCHLLPSGTSIAPWTALAIACRDLGGLETLARSEHVRARLAETVHAYRPEAILLTKACVRLAERRREIGVPRSCVVSVPYGPRPAPMIASASIQACAHCETLSPLMRCCSVVSAVFRISRAGCQSPSCTF